MNTIRVLYVDDDYEDQDIFREALDRIDLTFELRTAENGLDAFDKLEDFSPDIIFLDLNMPMMGGFEFLEKYRQSNQNVPVFIFTTSSDDEHKQRAAKLGAQQFVTKPLDFSVLKNVLSDILKNRAS